MYKKKKKTNDSMICHKRFRRIAHTILQYAHEHGERAYTPHQRRETV